MGLSSSLQIGRSALTASQLALQVTGNNIANVGTAGYHRQIVTMDPLRSTSASSRVFVGQGVQVSDVRRAIDPAVQTRLRNSLSDEQSANVSSSVLSQIESIMGELSGSDLSSELTKFFNAFSELANNPASAVNRSSVVEQGASLAGFIRNLRTELVNTRTQIDQQLGDNVDRANQLVSKIADLNKAIVNAENGRGSDGALRDQRDTLIDELAGLLDVTAIEQPSGAIDILVGSTPIVLGSDARGLELKFTSENGVLEARVLVSKSQETLRLDSGSIGGLLSQRDASAQRTIEDLDSLASSLIFEVNKLHSSGRPQSRITDTTGQLLAPLVDRSLALNDPTNNTLASLPFGPRNGSFTVIVTDASGNKVERTIQIDLDGIDSTGAAGFGDDTSLDDLVTALSGVPNLNAELTADGRLRVFTDAGYDVSFKDDTSGVLATLGVNSYFQGTSAKDIEVSSLLREDPLRLSLGLSDGSNETALAIAGLRDAGIESLGGDTIGERWLKTVERNAVETRSATTQARATASVRESLEAQQASVSGVSLDEETLNLIAYQQQYSGAARFISVVNELTDVLLGLV
jgi:flagellar hook-associated protein 1 FlgK